MSTRKTQNYQLNIWTAEDEERLEEVNENFARLDGASRVVAGSYSGNGAESQTIELGFTPTAVLVVNYEGKMGYTGGSVCVYGGLALPGRNLYADLLEITEGGFIARTKQSSQFLYLNTGLHYYLAFR